MTKKMSKQAKRRLTLLTPILLLSLAYLLFTIGTNALEIYKLQKEEKELKEELETLKGDSETLKKEINKFKKNDYLASYAREKYGYTKNDEYAIKINSKEEKKKKTKFTINDKYVIYGGYSLVTIVILILIIKHHKAKSKKKT